MPPSPPPPPLLRALLGLLGPLGLLVAGCAATGGGGPAPAAGAPLRVTLLDYLGNQSFEIVGESYTDRVEYLSAKREAANRKFLPDDVLAALLDHIEEEGMEAYGQVGRAPSSGRNVLSRAFEVERGDTITCWPVGKGTANEEKIAFTVLTSEFLQVYTEIPAFQAIENPEGRELFLDSERQKTGR